MYSFRRNTPTILVIFHYVFHFSGIKKQPISVFYSSTINIFINDIFYE